MRRAKAVMTKPVFTVTPEMTVREAANLLTRLGITGAPVVDKTGNVLGVVSQTDIVRRDREPARGEVPSFYRPGVSAGDKPPTSSSRLRVDAIMTPALFSADEETPLPELASFMLAKRLHRLIITRRGKLAGIVTTMDLVRAMLELVSRARKIPRSAGRTPSRRPRR